MRLSFSIDPTNRESNGGRLPKFPHPGGAAGIVAIVVLLAIAVLVWKRQFSPPPAAQVPANIDAAKASRAMTFTQHPEPSK
jgi:hypothetical protein